MDTGILYVFSHRVIQKLAVFRDRVDFDLFGISMNFEMTTGCSLEMSAARPRKDPRLWLSPCHVHRGS